MTLEGQAHAKINLGLHVLRKRGDGYHAIRTVLLRIGWADRVSVTSGPGLRMTCTDPALPTDDGNTCMLAARLLAGRTGAAGGAHIHLDKRIPSGAGLGGGSSDAAAVLKLLSRLWNVTCSERDLLDIAAEIGSDVPFFIGGRPSLAEGRGVDLTPFTCCSGLAEPYRFPFALAVAVPAVHVSTAEAYSRVEIETGARPDIRDTVCSNNPERWCKELVNDFEAGAAGLHPEIRVAREGLLDAGAVYVALSGSGSAVFGAFGSIDGARSAIEAGTFRDMRTWAGLAV